MTNISDTILVSIDFHNPDTEVLIEALELYKKLVSKKEKNNVHST